MKKKKRVYTKRTVIRGSRRERERSWGGGASQFRESEGEKGGKKEVLNTALKHNPSKTEREKKKRKEGGAAQQGVHAANLASLLLPCGSQLTT